MDENAGTNGPEDRPIGQIERLAREAGKIVGRTVQQVETTSRQLYDIASREARIDTQELKRRTSIVMDEAKKELPRLRAELREIEARVKERIK